MALDDDTIESLRRTFAGVLPERIASLREGLSRAGGGLAELRALHRTAHSLAGTAPAYGALEVGPPAGELSHLVMGWIGRGEPPADDERAEAARLIDGIEAAAAPFIERFG